jgi:hypothetical protein
MTLAVLSLIFGISCIAKANLIMFAMIGEINRKLPEPDQFSKEWRYPGKHSQAQSEYRQALS